MLPQKNVIAATFCLVFLTIVHQNVAKSDDYASLQLVHVLFRHGDRANDKFVMYPKDPYINETYAPYGLGELTNKGKKRMYRLGKALRERYDKFLGRHYHPNLLEALTSDKNRTKASLLLVLASLFPPTESELWEEGLNWQPIPYSHTPKPQDKIFFGIFCKNYKKLYKEYNESPKMLKEFEEHKVIFDFLSEHTGWNVTTYKKAFFLYLDLLIEDEWNYDLPDWTNHIYPTDILLKLALNEYLVATGTTALKQMASGYLLKKIVTDTKLKLEKKLTPADRKIVLYSGHELNIAYLLSTLDIFKPHVPPYGAYVLIEVHTVNDIHGIKIFYQDYSGREPELLKLPACGLFCPFEKFVELVEEYLPSDSVCDEN